MNMSSTATTVHALVGTAVTATTGPFNATRNPQAPLQQPSYNFQHVPNAAKDLKYSTLQKINNANRSIFQQSMAEMLLLCKEAVRRRKRRQQQRQPTGSNNGYNESIDGRDAGGVDTNEQNQVNMRRCSPRHNGKRRNTTTKSQQQDSSNHPVVVVEGSGNKPLSLEYIADRLDIDDPCFGYIIRTHDSPPLSVIDESCVSSSSPSSSNTNNSLWQSGMLQGFITATTFTNWQKSFRWDSVNEAAYYDDDEEYYDDDNNQQQQQRIRDVDGSLARELQSTVHCGNIHGEGIVWPRIAEISLLGGLGCGATLIRALIDELETSTKPTSMANYDYLVLQATDNSIPFYESMGFIRVGAIMLEEDQNNNSEEIADLSSDEIKVNISPGTTDQAMDAFISSPVFTHEVKSSGDSLTRIASKFHVDVNDILFLNRHLLGIHARPCDKPKIHAQLLIPKNSRNSKGGDNDYNPNDKIDGLPSYVPSHEIQWHVCKENDTPRTIAKMYNVSTYDIVERNKGRLPGLISSSRLKENTKIKVSHLNIPDNLYKPYAHWSFPDSKYEDPEPSYMMVRKFNRQRKVPNQMTTKKRPLVATSYERNDDIDDNLSTSFLSTIKGLIVENDIPNPSLLLSPPSLKVPPTTNVSTQSQQSSVLVTTTAHETNPYLPYSDNDPLIKASLYNKVVRLKPGAMTEGSDYMYWYVLTYIPDLQWCHLAPMIQDGIFGTDKARAFGKTKWRLLDEIYGQEVDISSKYCIPVKSRSMKKTLDADKEEWDIIDDGTDPTAISATSTYRRNSMNRSINNQRGTIAIKPSTERVRKMPPSSASSTTSFITESPSLLAALPGTGRITMVRLVGRLLFKQTSSAVVNVTGTVTTGNEIMYSSEKKRGRPFGSKNKPKSPNYDDEVSSPIGKKRRFNSPIIHLPASARKAAAIRTTSTIDKCSSGQNMASLKNRSTVNELHQTHSGMSKKQSTNKTTKMELKAGNTNRTLPPQKASLSSSTYSLETRGSTYCTDNNSDSETLTVESFHDDDDGAISEFEEKQPRTKRRISSTKTAGRRSSRLADPTEQVKTASCSLSELATPRRKSRCTSTYKELTVAEEMMVFDTDDVEEVVASKKTTARSSSRTPPSRLPKLSLVLSDDKERMLTIRSVDLTPSVYTEANHRLPSGSRASSKSYTLENGRKLVQQNLNTMIVPKGRTKSRSKSVTSPPKKKDTESHASRPSRRLDKSLDENSNHIVEDDNHDEFDSNRRPRRKLASYA